MFAEKPILVRIQMAQRRSAEPGNPEWKHTGLGDEEEKLLLGEAPGRLEFWEEAHGRMKAFRQPFFQVRLSTAPGKLFKLSLEAEMNERDLFISLKAQQARACSQNKSAQITYNV